MISNTYKLLDACKIEMEFHKEKTKKTYTGSLEGDWQLLEKLAMDGMQARYGMKNKIALERLQKELKIIWDMGFNFYFLSNMISYDMPVKRILSCGP